jgi:ubiquinol-cytochrome c reductase cytochrome c subunit
VSSGVPHGRGDDDGHEGVHEVERVTRRTRREDQYATPDGERGADDLAEDGRVEKAVRSRSAGRRDDRRAEERGRGGDDEPREQAMQLVHARHGSAEGTGRPVPPVNRRSGAGGWVAAALIAGGLLFLVAATPAPSGGPEAGGAVRNDGASLFLQNCASCHGPQGQGAAAGPSLVGVGAASADFYLRTGRMPLGAPGQRPVRQEPKFDEAQIQALVAYVASFGAGPAVPQVRAGGDLNRGWQLYTANCAACHAATGAGNAVGGGFVAVGLGKATPHEIAEAVIVGPGAMPKFSFPESDRDAIVAYVDYLRSQPSPGGAPIGGVGPVAEGFVSVVLGLTALVLIARFVGRRSHSGEPEGPLPPDDLASDGADAPEPVR